MYVSAISRIPQELWIDVATTLRNLPPLTHVNIVDPPNKRRCYYGKRHTRFCYATNTSLIHLFQSCRFLRNILEPLLYDTVVIDGLNTRQTPALIQTLVHRPDLLTYARTIIISESSKLNPADFDMFNLLLPGFRSLQHVYISRSTISPTITQLLVDTIHLQSLSVEGCDWSTDIPGDWSEGRFGGRLTELSLSTGPERQNPYKHKYNQLVVTDLRVLAIDGYFAVEDPLAWASSLTQLKTLIVDAETLATTTMLSNLLPLLPSVEELRVDDFFRWDRFELHADSLPQLRSLTGTLKLGRHFAGRKKIEHLHIQTFRTEIHDVRLVNERIIPFPSLKMLVLPQTQCNEETLRVIAHQYPFLTRLAIISHYSSVERCIDHGIVPAFHGFPCLEVLRLSWMYSGDDFDIPSEEEWARERGLLEEIRLLHCPRLREARISPGHRWGYLPDGGWTVITRQFIYDIRL